MGEATEAWGRVAEDGTVYVRTADGERQVGSWAAGSPDEALAYYQRKFDGLKVEVDLIANRLKQTGPSAPSPKDALDKIGKLRESISGANAVGDLDGLLARLDGLVELAEQRKAEHRAVREQQQAEARGAKQALAEEAERLAASTEWRVAGDRMKVLLDEWKAAPRLDRKTDDELWHRLSQARSAFAKRRKQHFAELDAQRVEIRAHKEQPDRRGRGPAGLHGLEPHRRPLPRPDERVEDRRPRAARRRGRALEALQGRAGHLLRRPQRGPGRAQRRRAREPGRQGGAGGRGRGAAADHRPPRRPGGAAPLNERWEAIGPVPRDARQRIEGRLHTVDRAIADAEAAELSRKDPEKRARAEATVEQLRDRAGEAAGAGRKGARRRAGEEGRGRGGFDRGSAGVAGRGGEGAGGVHALR